MSEGDVPIEIHDQALWDVEEKKYKGSGDLSEVPGDTTRGSRYGEVIKQGLWAY